MLNMIFICNFRIELGGRRRNTSGPRTMMHIHNDDHFDAFNLLGIPRDDSMKEQSYGEFLHSSSVERASGKLKVLTEDCKKHEGEGDGESKNKSVCEQWNGDMRIIFIICFSFSHLL